MTDYSKEKIYKFFNKVNDKYYIGSTTQELKYRKRSHKCKMSKRNSKLYKEILKLYVNVVVKY